MRLRAPSPTLATLHERLLSHAPQEAAAFLSVEPSGDDLVLRDVHFFGADDMADAGGELTLDEGAQAAELARIKRDGHALVEVHTHPGAHGPVHFSTLDEVELAAFARYVSMKLPGRPFGALVLGPDAYAGQLWHGRDRGLLVLAPAGERLVEPSWAAKATPAPTHEPVFDRQVRALGPEGQSRLRALRVGVIGAGGTGSAVVAQLAHLAVAEIAVVDPDRVEPSNLPRLVGAGALDARLQRRKTSVARRHVRRIGGRRTRITVAEDLRTRRALNLLRGVDVIVGCVDNDGARLILAELAAAHHVPYLDVGVGIEPGAGAGGRISFQLPGGPCLRCADEIDEVEAAQDLAPAALTQMRIARGYALDRRVEPALMPLNATVASLGLLELLAFCTGDRPVVPFQRFDATGRRLVTVNVVRDPDCSVCVAAEGMGDRQQIERYARDHNH